MDRTGAHRLCRGTPYGLAGLAKLDAREKSRALVQIIGHRVETWCDHAADIVAAR